MEGAEWEQGRSGRRLRIEIIKKVREKMRVRRRIVGDEEEEEGLRSLKRCVLVEKKRRVVVSGESGSK